MEYQSLNTLKAARVIEALDGLTAGISLTTVAQSPSGVAADSPAGTDNSQLNYRADAFVTLPLPKVGDTESRIFAQFRMGQGAGLNGMASYSMPNASAFRVLSAQPDDSVAVLGQAWYQASIPLPFGGFKPHSREKLEINFGKMDPFVFFDRNAAANDETKQFLNTVFVHNALLDAGGDIGAEIAGYGWDRAGDAIGMALGRLSTSPDFVRDSATVDANGDGMPDFGYTAVSGEQVAEIYYRYRINKQFELSPDFQYVSRPGGAPGAAAISVLRLRGQLTF